MFAVITQSTNLVNESTANRTSDGGLRQTPRSGDKPFGMVITKGEVNLPSASGV
jgi:hypothetical protein